MSLRSALRQLRQPSVAALRAPQWQHSQLSATRAFQAQTASAASTSGSSSSSEHSTFDVQDFSLQHGGSLRLASLAYKTYGDPKNPAVLFPTSFDCTHSNQEYAIGPGRILDTEKYFVVVPVSTRFLPPACAFRVTCPCVSSCLAAASRLLWPPQRVSVREAQQNCTQQLSVTPHL